MDSYYKQKQIIAKVDKKGNIIGTIDKWEAHKKGILHKAFSIALIYKDQLVLQHRKHIAFDGIYDVTSSSHQLVINGKLQDTLEAIYQTLKREWGLTKNDLLYTPKDKGPIYYKAKDPKSEFIEHELCDMYTVEVKKIPTPDFDFAYGASFVKLDYLKNKKSRIYQLIAPWSKKALEENKI